MNKKCTNSPCRKTFSTLTNGGICPFCGKMYPQILTAKKDICMIAFVESKRICLLLTETIKYSRIGEKIKAIKALLNAFSHWDFCLGLRDAKEYVEALMAGKKTPTRYCLTGKTTQRGNKTYRYIAPCP
ncbi:MAG: hypothetical protein IJD86_00605 [Clostridia bacterium]|nr:hypothetical protein [Clostridia bacterium]